MIDKRVIGGGFIGGVLLGIASMNSSAVADFYRGMTGEPPLATGAAPAVPSSQAESGNYDMSRQLTGQLTTQPVANSMPGADLPDLSKLSLRQLLFLSRIAGRTSGGQATYSSASSALPGGAMNRNDSAGALLQSIMGPRSVPDTSAGAGSRSALADDPSASFGRPFDPGPEAGTVVQPSVGAIDVRSGQYLAPAGPGGYVDPRDGTVYAPAGPNGVVNTRTGEYSPVSH